MLHIHLHAASQKKYANTKPTSNRSVNQTALRGLIDSLEASIKKLKWSPIGPGWAAYYEEEHSYTIAGLEHKQRLVKEYLSQINPRIVWDLGANTGMFSRIASDSGAFTVAFDFDPAAVELNYLDARKRQEPRILPLIQNLTNPSPAIGWQNQERLSLIERANADAVLALALVHHLTISNNVPLDNLANFLQILSPHLIIEFVPKNDPQVQRLLMVRQDIFSDYTQEQFETAFNRNFIIHKSETIQDSQRRIYLMERR
jgi:ribosomal protein L11 methylase PrmA